MIIQQRVPGRDLIITYSDNNKIIEQVGTGYRYAGAVDPDYMNRQYIETDEDISTEGLSHFMWEQEDYDLRNRIAILENALCELDMEGA